MSTPSLGGGRQPAHTSPNRNITGSLSRLPEDVLALSPSPLSALAASLSEGHPCPRSCSRLVIQVSAASTWRLDPEAVEKVAPLFDPLHSHKVKEILVLGDLDLIFFYEGMASLAVSPTEVREIQYQEDYLVPVGEAILISRQVRETLCRCHFPNLQGTVLLRDDTDVKPPVDEVDTEIIAGMTYRVIKKENEEDKHKIIFSGEVNNLHSVVYGDDHQLHYLVNTTWAVGSDFRTADGSIQSRRGLYVGEASAAWGTQAKRIKVDIELNDAILACERDLKSTFTSAGVFFLLDQPVSLFFAHFQVIYSFFFLYTCNWPIFFYRCCSGGHCWPALHY